MTQVSYILNRVSEILQDVDRTFWTESFLVDCLNDILKEVVVYKPNAYTKTEVITPVAGTRQTLPAGGTALIRVVCNMGTTGTNAGKSVRLVDQDQLDIVDPYWHGSTAKAETNHFAVDRSEPSAYYISPPTTSQLKIVYALNPPTVTAGSTVPLDDLYVPALIKGVLSMAYASDGEHASNAQLAAMYYQAFTSMLGGKAQGEIAADANTTAPSNSVPK